MADRPLLFFPSPGLSARAKGHGGRTKVNFPSHAQQRQRLGPQFKALEKAFSDEAQLQRTLSGASPEEVIVLETVGTVEDFARVVANVEGFQWMAEQVEEYEPDTFFFDEKSREKALTGRLFLVMSNQKALKELLTLWKLYKKSTELTLSRGMAPWKHLFRQLRTVRLWNANDRLHPDVLRDWAQREREKKDRTRVEIELWFRRQPTDRDAAQARLTRLLLAEEGTVVSSVALDAIAYHAMLVDLPTSAVKRIAHDPATRLVQSHDIMFFRPVSQLAVRTPNEAEEQANLGLTPSVAPRGLPVVALLDGLPLEQHEVLASRLIVDDPDGWSGDYPADKRSHGTAMASLIMAGDLNSREPYLERPLYVRPILMPESSGPLDEIDERMPADQLPVDLIHRAVRRMFESDGQQAPVAPTIRIVNFSVGDSSRLFDRRISPLARLLDWLAVKYNLLFVVSAGNHIDKHPDYLELPIAAADYPSASPDVVEAATIKALAGLSLTRRLLSPAEAVNVLTAAALQRDSGPANSIPSIRELLRSPTNPCPLNALGFGYGRSVKPDVLAPGGRAYYKLSALPSPFARFSIVVSPAAPACRVASPGAAGSRRGYSNSCGTSNAAALTTRTAARLLEVIEALRRPDGSPIEGKYVPLMLRALLVHSCRWGDARKAIELALADDGYDWRGLRQLVSRFLGYGAIDFSRVAECTERRATIVSAGSIKVDEGHEYSLPLPVDLSGQKVWRRLVVTLAWFAPTNPETLTYRRAQLSIDPPHDQLRVKRVDADDKAVRRGTIQHEILEGDDAVVFATTDSLGLKVSCQGEPALREAIPYALATTLEVAEGEPIRIYEEIRSRLALPIPVPAMIVAAP